jgi:hypothetical protein
MNKVFLILIVIIALSCNSQTNNKLEDVIEVVLNKDSSSLVVKGIDPFILKELAADSLNPQEWENNLAVYPKAKEEDLQDLEKSLKGNFKVQNSTIVFKPLNPFVKSKTYIVELYLQHPNGSIIDKLKPSNSPFNQTPIRKEVRF